MVIKLFFILSEGKQTLINRLIKKRYNIAYFMHELENYNEKEDVFTKILCGAFDYLFYNAKNNEKYIIFKYKKATNNILEIISIKEKRDLWS